MASWRFSASVGLHATQRHFDDGLGAGQGLADEVADLAVGGVGALARRNTVIARMEQLGWISPAQAAAAEKTPIKLRPSAEPNGCAASYAPFFCDYVKAVITTDHAYHKAAELLNGIGGLKVRTTLSSRDQVAAQHAVDYEMPPNNHLYNPGHNADTEVLIQPGTGKVRGIAINRVPRRYSP